MPEQQRLKGALTYTNANTDEPEVVEFAGGHAGVFTTPCPGADAANEDACALVPIGSNAGILVLADGMGGGSHGHRASAVAVELVATTARQNSAGDELLRTVILNSFEKANLAVQKIVGAATTMVAVEIESRTVRPYNVGDSSVFVVGGRGKIKHQSIAHSPTGYGVEGGFLDDEEALKHDERHLVSNMIGMPEMHIEVGPRIALSPRDSVVLASDGLTDNLRPEEIAALARLRPLERALRALVEATIQRMTGGVRDQPSKPDDLTIVMYRL